MRKLTMLVLLSVICLSSCKEKPEEVLTEIQKNSTTINSKLKEYTKKQVDDITSATGGLITGYYRDDEVKKITAEHYTDTCRTFTDYYFDDGMLIFVEKQNFVYNRPNTYTEEKAKANNDSVWYDDKKTRMEISLYYFNKNKLVKWTTPAKTEAAPGSPDFADQQSAIWAETVILIKELKEGNANP